MASWLSESWRTRRCLYANKIVTMKSLYCVPMKILWWQQADFIDILKEPLNILPLTGACACRAWLVFQYPVTYIYYVLLILSMMISTSIQISYSFVCHEKLLAGCKCDEFGMTTNVDSNKKHWSDSPVYTFGRLLFIDPANSHNHTLPMHCCINGLSWPEPEPAYFQWSGQKSGLDYNVTDVPWYTSLLFLWSLGIHIQLHIWTIYVTGFETTRLPRTQQEDTLFTITR